MHSRSIPTELSLKKKGFSLLFSVQRKELWWRTHKRLVDEKITLFSTIHCVYYGAVITYIILSIEAFVPNQQNASSAIHKLESCLVDVIQWMGSHSLKLNNDKSEMILLGSAAHLAKVKVSHINIVNCKIKPSVVCKNLGVTFDSAMSMSNQVSNICKSVWYQFRNLGFIRNYLTRSTTEKIVHALISSRFDYCNSLFCLLQQNQISRLQRLQNTAARLVTLSPRRTHITPVLSALHWLPVQYRIQYKLLLPVFHSLHGSAPQYNCQLITRYNPSIDVLDHPLLRNWLFPEPTTIGVTGLFLMLALFFGMICLLVSVTCLLFISSKRPSKPTFSQLLLINFCVLPCAMSITCGGYRRTISVLLLLLLLYSLI